MGGGCRLFEIARSLSIASEFGGIPATEAVKGLWKMGFEKTRVFQCLQAASGNPDMALEYLLGGNMDVSAGGMGPRPATGGGSGGGGFQELVPAASHFEGARTANAETIDEEDLDFKAALELSLEPKQATKTNAETIDEEDLDFKAALELSLEGAKTANA
eukprot:symbB.v1.2.007226.t1/scaffold441.1/size205278/13